MTNKRLIFLGVISLISTFSIEMMMFNSTDKTEIYNLIPYLIISGALLLFLTILLNVILKEKN